MDETPRFAPLRFLLAPVLIALAIPAFVFLASILAIRTLFVAVIETAAAMLPWRRAETRIPLPFRGPHFRPSLLEAEAESTRPAATKE
jgi:hypothetical protein